MLLASSSELRQLDLSPTFRASGTIVVMQDTEHVHLCDLDIIFTSRKSPFYNVSDLTLQCLAKVRMVERGGGHIANSVNSLC